MDKRLGKFRIDFKTIEYEPEIAKIILKDVLVVRAEARYDMLAIEYIGISKKFDKIAEGAECPIYSYYIGIFEEGIDFEWYK